MQSRRQICYSGDEDAEQSTTKARYHYTRRFKFSVLDAPISIQRKQTKKTTKKKKKKQSNCDTKLTPKNNNHLFSQQSFTASPWSDPVSRSVLQESRDRERNRKPMEVQAPGEIQIAEGTKKERLSPPTPTSPRILHIVHKIDRRKACSRKYYTPSLAAQWKVSATERRNNEGLREEEETGEEKA
jgi:hypothetical protein